MCGFHVRNEIKILKMASYIKVKGNELKDLGRKNDFNYFENDNIFIKKFRLINKDSLNIRKNPMILEKFILIFNRNIINCLASVRKNLITKSLSIYKYTS